MKLPNTMKAMVTMGHGDLDQMVLHTDWPRPEPAADEVLIKVGACGMNNTDVNTRSGWYSKSVSEATTGGAFEDVGEDDPTWGGAPIRFPRIQGADVCGEIVAVGAKVDPARIGERVITDGWLRDANDLDNINKTGYFGSERDGGFAEYTTTPARNALPINSDTRYLFLFLFHRRRHAEPRTCYGSRHGFDPRRIRGRWRRIGTACQAARRACDCDGIRGKAHRGREIWT